MLHLRLLEQVLQMLAGDVHALMARALERVGALVELDGDSAVVHLVGDGERGVVAVGGAHEPQAVRDGDFAVVKRPRVAVPRGGNQLEHPFVMAGHFQNRQDLGEVVLHARQVHLVEHDEAGVLPQARFVQGAQKLGFVEALGELVEVAEHLGAIADRRLHRDDGSGVVHVAAERIRQRRFTGTGDALQDEQLAGGHAGDVAAHDFGRVVQPQLAAGELAVALHEVL